MSAGLEARAGISKTGVSASEWQRGGGWEEASTDLSGLADAPG